MRRKDEPADKRKRASRVVEPDPMAPGRSVDDLSQPAVEPNEPA